MLIWLAGLAGALWWYSSNYFRPFSESAALFSGEQIHLPDEIAGKGPVRFVHFWQPSCPCNAGNQQHLVELMQKYNDRVHFYHVQKPGTTGKLPVSLRNLHELEAMAGSEQLPASPAVAIFDQEGRLAYFGPYSEGAICTSANSFVEPILDALHEGRPVAAANTLASGCFCDWNGSL